VITRLYDDCNWTELNDGLKLGWIHGCNLTVNYKAETGVKCLLSNHRGVTQFHPSQFKKKTVRRLCRCKRYFTCVLDAMVYFIDTLWWLKTIKLSKSAVKRTAS
jgi:hypothetical protein